VNRVLRQIGAQIDHEASGTYVPFADALLHGARPRRPVRRMATWSISALAAGVALMVGIGIGQTVNLWRGSGGAGGPVLATCDEAAHRLLQAALERELSGQSVSWSDAATQRSVTVQPLRTYRAEGTFCREYRETNTVAQRAAAPVYGLACRRQDGTWDVAFTLAPGAQPLLVRQ